MYLPNSQCKCDSAANIKFHLEILAKSAARSLGPCYPQDDQTVQHSPAAAAQVFDIKYSR